MIFPHDPPNTSDERFQYILRYGVLGWGLLTGVLWSILMTWWGFGSFWLNLAIALVFFPIGGWFWGCFMWRMGLRHHSEPPMSSDK